MLIPAPVQGSCLTKQVGDLLSAMRFFEQPAILIEAGRTEVVSRILMRCVTALGTLDGQLLQCAPHSSVPEQLSSG